MWYAFNSKPLPSRAFSFWSSISFNLCGILFVSNNFLLFNPSIIESSLCKSALEEKPWEEKDWNLYENNENNFTFFYCKLNKKLWIFVKLAFLALIYYNRGSFKLLLKLFLFCFFFSLFLIDKILYNYLKTIFIKKRIA